MSKWETEFRFVMFLILICIYENIFQDSHSRNSVSERFLAAENQRARELERLIDSHIEQLKIGTEATLRKYNVKRWCHLLLWCNLFLCSVHLMRTGWFSAAKQEISVIYHTKCNLYICYQNVSEKLRTWCLGCEKNVKNKVFVQHTLAVNVLVIWQQMRQAESDDWFPMFENIIIGCVNICIRTQCDCDICRGLYKFVQLYWFYIHVLIIYLIIWCNTDCYCVKWGYELHFFSHISQMKNVLKVHVKLYLFMFINQICFLIGLLINT